MKKINILILLFVIMSSMVYAYSVEEEVKLGKQGKKEVDKMFTQTKYPEKQKELETIGHLIEKQCERHDFDYEYHVGTFSGKNASGYNENAFAMPGGYVYFGEALWDIMNYDERCGIIAHEITHVDRKHALKQNEKNTWTTLGLAVLVGLTKNNTWANLGASILQTVMSNNYSISDEKEADKKGTDKLIKSGLNPCGVLFSMRKISRMEDGATDGIPAFLMDHPKTKERIKYLTEYLEDKDITVPEEKIEYKYSEDVIGKISKVEYDGKDVEKLKFKLDKEIELKVGDTVYIEKFAWNNTYEYLKPVSFGVASIKKINEDDIELKYTKNLTKSKAKIEKGDVVALSIKEDKK